MKTKATAARLHEVKPIEIRQFETFLRPADDKSFDQLVEEIARAEHDQQ
jgi:hypothetical protein